MSNPVADPRIRVITVCRNDLDGLRRTAATVDSQTTPPTEHIIQDGASTDGTPGWLADRSPAAWRHWRSEPDRGIYDAMNRALEVEGDWDLVIFLNAGDRFADDEVLRRVGDSWRAERWGWAYGSTRMLRRDGSLVRVHELDRLAWPRFVTGVRSVPHQAAVLSRALVDEVGLHRTDVGLSADQEYLLRCWLHVPPVRLGTIVADCDAAGVSAQQSPGAFALQMREHRRALGHVILGGSVPDRLATAAAVGWDTAKRRYGGVLRAVRA